MSKSKIAFQGRKGAYSYLACENLYPNLETRECSSFREVFEAVEKGDVKLGLVPIENSTAGIVVDVHNLLRETDLHIIREFFMPINHCLLGVKGSSLKTINTVYSHTQALSQCELNLRKHGYKQQEASDTAGAAKMVAEDGNVKIAAIASKFAAKEYGLEILENKFQDKENNTTRFLVISNSPLKHCLDNSSYVTTIIFKVKNTPSALYKALGGFATNNINLLKLESYICDGGFKSVEFYMDIEGHIDEKCMINAIEELNLFAKNIKILGCYQAHKFRKTL